MREHFAAIKLRLTRRTRPHWAKRARLSVCPGAPRAFCSAFLRDGRLDGDGPQGFTGECAPDTFQRVGA
ncbi:hypothetical protein CHLRE_07g330276v5 [Chlamydomonas reinhardtii]|uniref:Uncharacterized protein n=1 Tax=Chlamydomonas reinhardtii TaxID=3055 RepID=A0A2K3DJU9_CHLRE|nr:uncharacterized protein CHLRE_07g330276v5 [Chlamydomonas reinhardtii]PNW80805.1 hypothetical protein CHLRE_07g330276v5 [Chlamydomonas reinhardtii]